MTGIAARHIAAYVVLGVLLLNMGLTLALRVVGEGAASSW